MNEIITLGGNVLKLNFPEIFNTEPEKTAPETPTEPKITQSSSRSAELQQPEALEVYKTYLASLRISSQIQTDILKGLRAGESVYSLFLKAAKAISLMTNSRVFYNEAEEELLTIYGSGLLEKAPLEIDLQDTRKRLQRLSEAAEREIEPYERNRIAAAIEAHRARVARLENLIQ